MATNEPVFVADLVIFGWLAMNMLVFVADLVKLNVVG